MAGQGSGKLRANPEDIRMAAKSVKAAGEDFESVISKLKRTITSLESEWQGDAQRKLADAFESHESTFRDFRELIASYAKELEDYSNELQALDQELSRSQQG